jgi:hypothetical protein
LIDRWQEALPGETEARNVVFCPSKTRAGDPLKATPVAFATDAGTHASAHSATSNAMVNRELFIQLRICSLQ